MHFINSSGISHVLHILFINVSLSLFIFVPVSVKTRPVSHQIPDISFLAVSLLLIPLLWLLFGFEHLLNSSSPLLSCCLYTNVPRRPIPIYLLGPISSSFVER